MPPPPPPPQTLSQSGRPLRLRRLPARYQDIYPEPPHPVPSTSTSIAAPSVSTPTETAVVPRVLRLIVRNRFQTNINAFGLWKDYRYRPSQDPDAFISPEDLYRANTSNTADSTAVPGLRDTVVSSPSPYKTNSIKLVIDWQNTGSSAKSNEEINRLVCDILRHPDFRLGKLEHFNAAHENCKANAAEEDSPFLQSFTHANISIDVPSGSKHKAPHTVSIPGLYFRKITSLIEEAFQSPLA
jgi:hypothetical protein